MYTRQREFSPLGPGAWLEPGCSLCRFALHELLPTCSEEPPRPPRLGQELWSSPFLRTLTMRG